MSKPPDYMIELSETLSLCEYKDPKNEAFGFWLYDETRGMNLSMRAKTERDAFVEALTYYQKRLKEAQANSYMVRTKVDAFIAQFSEDDEAHYDE